MSEALKPVPETAQQATDLPVLSVVVPTFNERDNIAMLSRKLEATLETWLASKSCLRSATS
jgi:dolichol-phosphate mannosyltransferase